MIPENHDAPIRSGDLIWKGEFRLYVSVRSVKSAHRHALRIPADKLERESKGS